MLRTVLVLTDVWEALEYRNRVVRERAAGLGQGAGNLRLGA